MTYEEKKKVVEAAKVIQEICDNVDCRDCPFWSSNNEIDCEIKKFPTCWKIPTITRWTPEDVALAKALKAVGAKVIYNTLGRVYWRTDNVCTHGELPNGAFTAIEKCESFSIDTIIKEAEG